MIAWRIKIDTRKFEAAVQRKMARFPENVDKAVQSLIRDADTDLHTATAKLNPPMETSTVRVRVGTYQLISNDIRWFSLNYGVRRHDISAHTSKGMIFPWANSRKRGEHIGRTMPNRLFPGNGEGNDTYKSGASTTVFHTTIDHPGVKPRKYRQMLVRKYKKLVRPRIISALRNV